MTSTNVLFLFDRQLTNLVQIVPTLSGSGPLQKWAISTSGLAKKQQQSKGHLGTTPISRILLNHYTIGYLSQGEP